MTSLFVGNLSKNVDMIKFNKLFKSPSVSRTIPKDIAYKHYNRDKAEYNRYKLRFMTNYYFLFLQNYVVTFELLDGLQRELGIKPFYKEQEDYLSEEYIEGSGYLIKNAKTNDFTRFKCCMFQVLRKLQKSEIK